MASADSTDDVSVTSSGKRRLDDTAASEANELEPSSQKRICVEEVHDGDAQSIDSSNICDTSQTEETGQSVTAANDVTATANEVPGKDADETDMALDSNSSSAVNAENNDLPMTENSSSASIKTDDSASSDGLPEEKDKPSSSAERDATSNDDDHGPLVLALNLTKTNGSGSDEKVSSRNAANTFVVVENESGDDSLDAPIDLSSGPKSYRSVMVNGSEGRGGGLVNGHVGSLKFADPSVIRKYEEELRNEETKLVLLKKIRHSQAVHRANDKHPASSSSVMIAQSLSGPPPLVRGGAGFQSSTMSGGHRTEVSRPHAQLSSSSQAAVHQSSHGPPPLVMAPRLSASSATTNRSSSSLVTHGGGQTIVHHGYRPSQPSQTPEQTAAQRQAAAKVALRRQLEKTLLQIPPPKPPPPEMNFIPNINTNAEFVMLVGLEEAVKCIVDVDAAGAADSSSTDAKYVLTPFECVQCQTDFTPVWKRDRPGSKAVICERCVTTNQKRALKQEHTNRLKGAFVRALQQEQEIEQSLLAGVTSGSNTPPPPQPLVTSSSRNSSASLKPGTETARHYPSISSYSSSPSLRSTSMNLPSAAAAAFTASRLMFPYQHGLVPSSTASSRSSSSSMDLPRQNFLLDSMLQRRPPVDGQVLWRT